MLLQPIIGCNTKILGLFFFKFYYLLCLSFLDDAIFSTVAKQCQWFLLFHLFLFLSYLVAIRAVFCLHQITYSLLPVFTSPHSLSKKFNHPPISYSKQIFIYQESLHQFRSVVPVFWKCFNVSLLSEFDCCSGNDPYSSLNQTSYYQSIISLSVSKAYACSLSL